MLITRLHTWDILHTNLSGQRGWWKWADISVQQAEPRLFD